MARLKPAGATEAALEPEPPRSGEWRFVAVVCVLGLLLRCFELDAQLWYDEIVTLVRFVRLPASELLTTYTTLNNHVLYSLEAKAAISLFGEHAWTLRLPAALFGVGSIAVAYALARQALGIREARLATLLLAVSYHHVWFSQSARGYTELLFFSLLGTLVFLRAAGQPGFRPWIVYALAIAAAGYTHLTAALFFASHAIVYLGLVCLRRRRGRGAANATADLGASWRPLQGMALGAALTALLYVPIVPQMVEAFAEVTGGPPLQASAGASRPPGEWKSPIWTALEVVRSFGSLGPLLALAVPVALWLFVWGARSLCARNSVLASIYLVNIPFTLVVLLLAGFRLWPRYFFLDIAFLLACMTRGLFAAIETLRSRLAWSDRTKRAAELVGGALALAASLVLLPRNYRYPKQDFEGAMQYVANARASADRVAVAGLARIPYGEFYEPGWTMVADAHELEELRAEPGRTFLVFAFEGHMQSRHADVMALADEEFSRVGEFHGTVSGGDVVVMRSER
jgi:4-amino-4-deoxy-L-arabinose transferase-like glycosyltransferase